MNNETLKLCRSLLFDQFCIHYQVAKSNILCRVVSEFLGVPEESITASLLNQEGLEVVALQIVDVCFDEDHFDFDDSEAGYIKVKILKVYLKDLHITEIKELGEAQIRIDTFNAATDGSISVATNVDIGESVKPFEAELGLSQLLYYGS